MKKIMLVLLSCAAMQAATIQLGISDNEGNGLLTTRTYNVAGIGLVTVTAFTNTAGVWSQSQTTQFGVAQSTAGGGQNLGIGVCNASEVSSGGACNDTNAEWQVDNNGTGRDYVLISFPTLVNSLIIRIQQTSSAAGLDADTAFASTSSTVMFTLANISTLGANLVNQANNGVLTGTGATNATSNWQFRDILVGNNVGQVLFGVNTTQDNDFFKLLSFSADAAVPEPGSLALLGGGLLALGAIARRRRKQ